jgi:hypothetical protein
MTLKYCSCGQMQTTKNSDFKGEMHLDPTQPRMLLFTCRKCRSTIAVTAAGLRARQVRPTRTA